MLATPAYASPEQLRNEPVTTACDVYSLGAVLSELLAGRRSARRTSAAVLLERALSGQEPDRVENCITPEAGPLRGTTEAKLRQSLKGDLSVITAKCQRASPDGRYRSVEALAEDIRRHLSGRTVLATPQTFSYQLAKFLRRNRRLATVSALAFFVLVGALGYAAMRRREDLRQAQRAVQMQSFMTELFKLANTQYMGKPAATVPDLLRLGSTVLPQMIREPSDQRAAEISLAESMFWDSDFKDAEASLDRTIADAKAAHDLPAEAEAEAYGGMAAYKLGDIQKGNALSSHALQLADTRGVTPETRVYIEMFYTQSRYALGRITPADVAILRAAVKEAHDAGVSPDGLAYASLSLALIGSGSSPLPAQEKLAQEAVSILRGEPWAICELAMAEGILGYLQHETGPPQASVQTYRDSWNGYKTCRGEDSHDALMAAGDLGRELVDAGETQKAISLLEPTLQKMNHVMGPTNLELMMSLSALSHAYVQEGQYQKAADLAARLFHMMDGKINPNSSQLGFVHLLWARALAGENKNAEALEQAKMADAAYRSVQNTLPAFIANAKRAHQLVLDLQAKLAKNSK